MKVSFFNPKLWKMFASIISILCGIESFVLIFLSVEEYALCAFVANIIVIVLIYIGCLVYANKKTKKEIKIGNSNIIIKFGDLFDENGRKVIAFNEFFDTLVDEKIISSKTLNGFVLNNYIHDINSFDQKLLSDAQCNARIIEQNVNRISGKTTRYKLGTCFRYEDLIAVAFSRFDDNNHAYLSMSDYLSCLSEFWVELNGVYNGEDVVVPLLGSGITRPVNGSKLELQKQLEILINTLKYNNLHFSHDTTITIVVPENTRNDISLFDL